MNHSSESSGKADGNSSCTTIRGALVHSGAYSWGEHWSGDHGERNGSYSCTSQLSSELTEIVQLFTINSKVLRASED